MRRARNEVVERIRAVVDSVPRGSVATYGLIAREAGVPRNARQVGRVLRDLPAGSSLPWHRILNARGELRAPGASAGRQRRLLREEGIPFVAADRVDLDRCLWDPNE